MIEEHKNNNNPWQWYDLIYGILFQPVTTYRRVALAPPLLMTVVVVAGLNAVLAVLDINSAHQLPLPAQLAGGGASVQALLDQIGPYLALASFTFSFLLWFIVSAILHMLAEFFGGTGRALGTFTAYGLAGLPALLLLPFQSLTIMLPGNGFFANLAALASLVVILWGLVLIVIGLREVHQFTTGRAVLVLITPLLLLLVLLITLTALLLGAFSSLLPMLEQMGKL